MRIYAPDILNASMYRAVEFKVAEHPFSVDRSRITVYLSKAQLAELFAQVDAEESAERGDMVDDNSPSARMAAIWDKPVTPDDVPSVQHDEYAAACPCPVCGTPLLPGETCGPCLRDLRCDP